MRFSVIIAALALATFSCQKDAVIPTTTSETLSDYFSFNSKSYHNVSLSVWAQAGNHPDFHPSSKDKPILIRYYHPKGATKAALFISDSIDHPYTHEWYRQSRQSRSLESGGIFSTFSLSNVKDNRPRLIRIAYVFEDSLFLSPHISIRPDQFSTNTKNASNVSVTTTATGQAYFEWNGSFDAAGSNLVMLTNSAGTRFCAVETTDASFIFHNLRNVATDFTPELYDPKLLEGQSYILEIFMTDNSGWMRNYRSVEFKMDSTISQTFD